VLLDEDPVRYTRPGAARGVLAFYVLAAMAYHRGRPYVAAVEAVPRLNQTAWAKFLNTLGGQPQWVVTDGGGPVRGGAGKAWPDAEFWRCEWHLAKNLKDPLPPYVQEDPEDPLNRLLRVAQLAPRGWQDYLSELRSRATQDVNLSAAVAAANRRGPLIAHQAGCRPTDLPVSTGPLEQFLHATDSTIGDRAANMTNKRRADALLKLLAASRNGWVRHDEWTAILSDHLATRRGLAMPQRRYIDPRTAPSLR
jgi:hypothetical protein